MNFVRNTCNKLRKVFKKNEPVLEWKKVGEVIELNIYPLMEAQKLKVDQAVCTKGGLTHENTTDGNFFIFKTTNTEVCSKENFSSLHQISLKGNIKEGVTLNASYIPMLEFSLSDYELEKAALMGVRIHQDEMIFVKDCGDIASRWVSEYLVRGNRGFRLGYYDGADYESYVTDYEAYMKENKNQLYAYMNSRHNPLTFHKDITNRYSLLNKVSFDSVSDKVKLPRNNIVEYDFRPNIIIKTDDLTPFQECKWKKIKINNTVFEFTDYCQKCAAVKMNSYSANHPMQKEAFYDELKRQLKSHGGVNIKNIATPSVAFDMKIVEDEGPISCGDAVYTLMRA